MNFKDEKVYISDIPFPAVTICPETKVLKEKLDLVSVYHNLKKQSRNNETTIKLTKNEWEIAW